MPTHINFLKEKKFTNQWLKKICCVSITIYMLAHINIKKIKQNQWGDNQYILNKPKCSIVFTHLHHKCYNIFRENIYIYIYIFFSVVVGHSLIFYYFISTYKKLTPQ